MKPLARASSVLVGCILVVALTRSAAAETFKLSGHVLKSSGKNVVYVALWPADAFLKHPLQQIRIEPGAEPVFQFEVAGGVTRSALSRIAKATASSIRACLGRRSPAGSGTLSPDTISPDLRRLLSYSIETSRMRTLA